MTDVKPDDVLQGLLDGNRRFVEGRMEHAHESPTDRDALLEEQHPCVTLLGCSDSRVPPSVIFDVGLGQVFSIRIAGHVLSDEVRASVRYAAVHLGTPLVLVEEFSVVECNAKIVAPVLHFGCKERYLDVIMGSDLYNSRLVTCRPLEGLLHAHSSLCLFFPERQSLVGEIVL